MATVSRNRNHTLLNLRNSTIIHQSEVPEALVGTLRRTLEYKQGQAGTRMLSLMHSVYIGIRAIGYSELDMASPSSPHVHVLEDEESIDPVLPASPPLVTVESPNQHPLPSEGNETDDYEEDHEEDPEKDPEEDPDEEPSDHVSPTLCAPQRPRFESDDIARLTWEVKWADDRIEQPAQELRDANA
ncbi:hypothetical protein E3N88_18413 [Mikania micrantha]|uniref:Uncharacterized protein n=1 Tax=Mikania micrantha TaxID=192012 RepID=A0A5N6NN95_9ASTR|nr:hypothetical protein E3N88_18413 [Mikania micrantha]